MSDTSNEKEMSLEPPVIKAYPTTGYGDADRKWQGIPGIERTRKGRIWVTFFSGGNGEGPQYNENANYVVLINSDDDGQTWSEPVLYKSLKRIDTIRRKWYNKGNTVGGTKDESTTDREPTRRDN